MSQNAKGDLMAVFHMDKNQKYWLITDAHKKGFTTDEKKVANVEAKSWEINRNLESSIGR